VLNANPFALHESDLFDLRVIATSTLANPLTKLN
jgi:hypothetical protein